MPPRASVIIPNLDCALAGRAVASVLDQDLADQLEIVVVGRDEPGVVPPRAPVTFVETAEPLPPAAARNVGVERARAEALLFVDADCLATAGWAARLLAALDSSEVVGGAVRFALAGNRWAVADNIASFAELLEDRPSEDNPQRPFGSLNLATTRRSWNRIGPFDEELVTGEDHDWYFRARALQLGARFEPKAVVEHLQVRTSKRELVTHARWYGRHFHAFRAKHPEIFGRGPTWKSRRRLAAAAPLKALLATIDIFRRHPMLRRAWPCFSRVLLFKLVWYRAVIESWPESS
jgi:glycosyltransferase involved in cell wall biosynthesis